MIQQDAQIVIFGDDDVTPLLGSVDVNGAIVDATCSTVSTHARPYLLPLGNGVDSSISFVDGTASIGQINLSILDKRKVATDQATGWFTELMALNGESRISGRMVRVELKDNAGAWYHSFTGVVGDHNLDNNMVKYNLSLRDTKERGRKVRLFTKIKTSSLFPAGPVDGYGKLGNNEYVVDPSGVLKGKFIVDVTESRSGRIVLNTPIPTTIEEMRQTPYRLYGHVQPTYDAAGTYTGHKYSNMIMKWRYPGGAWTTLENMPYYESTATYRFLDGIFSIITPKGKVEFQYFPIHADVATSLPTNGSDVEIQVIANSYPSERTPFFFEGSFGQFLKNAYDGQYSISAPRIPYNTARMTELIANTPTMRLIKTESEDDMEEWLSKNWYSVLGMVPALDEHGKIYPIAYALPDVNATLLNIDDSNCINGSWSHRSSSAVTSVTFMYKRDYVGRGVDVNTPILDRIRSVDVEHTYKSVSTLMLGEQAVDYEPETIRSITNSSDGTALTGNTADEYGAQLSRLRAYELIDRFRYGGQHMSLTVSRGDAAISAAKPGDWAVVSISWFPDMKLYKRGSNILAQIVKISNVDAKSRSFELVAAGPMDQPVGVPTIGVPTNSNGYVSVPVTAVVATCDARVDYAVSATQPVANSGLWTFAGRRSSTGTITIPYAPPGSTVWIRGRTEAPGRRPSGWTAAQSIAIPQNPTPSYLKIVINALGKPVVSWKSSASMLGARLSWRVAASRETLTSALTGTVDLAASTESYEINTEVPHSGIVVVEVQGYTGFATGAVSGTAGVKIVGDAERDEESGQTYIEPHVAVALSETSTTGTVTLTITDPQARLSRVQFSTRAGKGSWTAFANAASPYVKSVSMIDKHASYVHYRVYGYLPDGAEVVVKQDIVTFGMGSRPLKPEVVFNIDASGNLQVGLSGDSDTAYFKVLGSKTGAPTESAVAATAQRNGRYVSVDNVLALNPDDAYWVTAIAYNSVDLASEVVTRSDKWLGVGFAPTAAPFYGTIFAESSKITYGVELGTTTSFLEAWYLEYKTDPGTVASVRNIGTRVPGTPIRRGDGRTYVSVPVSAPGHFVVITFVPYDSLNREGTPQTYKTQAAAVASTPPAAPTATHTSVTTTSVTNSITVLANSLLRTYLNGVVYGSDISYATSGAKSVQHTGLQPGTAYTFEYTQIVGGVESAKSTALVATTTANPALAAPFVEKGSDSGSFASIYWNQGTNPDGTSYKVYRNAVYDKTVDTTSTGIAGVLGDQFYVIASKSGYTDSVASNTVTLEGGLG